MKLTIEQKAEAHAMEVAERFFFVPDSRINRHDVAKAAKYAYIAGYTTGITGANSKEIAIAQLEGAIAALSDVVLNLDNNQAGRAWEFAAAFREKLKETEELLGEIKMTPIYTRCENCQLKFDYYGGEHAICSGCVSEAVQSVKDFERLALEWKDNYNKLKRESDIKIVHLEQTIENLKNEIVELNELIDRKSDGYE